MTDALGNVVSETSYKPWGEVRSWWTSGLSTTPAYKLASYTFTVQYSYMDDPSTTYLWAFGVSTQAYQKQKYGKDCDFHWLEERLRPLNFRIVFCTRSPESFEAARDERLKVSGNPSQYDDLNAFIHEQEVMHELIAESMLPGLTLDISDNDINAAVERVADWLEVSDGLYMPD